MTLLPDGWAPYMAAEEYEALSAAVEAIPPDLHGLPVVEIGAGVGTSGAVIAQSLISAGNPGRLVIIDPMVIGGRKTHRVTGGKYRDQAAAVKHSLKPYADRVEVRQAPSMDVLDAWDDEIALVHVDGDHTQDAAYADLGWTAHLAIGGLVVMHDIGEHLATRLGPTRALLKWFTRAADFRLLVQVKRIVVAQRVG